MISPVQVEIFRNLFASVCDEMGAALLHASYSPNIKERRDFSCALFDDAGRLIAQGDHMPVHLGSMPASVKAVLDSRRLEPGDVALLNDPFQGGTHLPDLTMVAPCRFEKGKALFHVANRAHQSDIGGMTPGSMPLATEIFQEGLRIPPILLRRGGQLDKDLLNLILANVRTPREREGDLSAQIASLEVGARRIDEMYERHGGEVMLEQASALIEYAEKGTRALISTIPDGIYEFVDYIEDDGMGGESLAIQVKVTINADEAEVDFTGTSPQASGPVNAVSAITRSAVIYVFRCLLPSDVPANDGCFAPISLTAPEGCLVNARPPAAVAAGNVETSQRIVDVVFGALAKALPDRIPAASSGTMNNLSLGGRRPGTGTPFAYYETLGGGMGGRPGSAGLSGIHTHMTNSLNTPVEAMEHDLPVIIRRYRLRETGGGAGKHAGGRGLIREYEFLTDTSVTLLSERRSIQPWGTQGGGPGACGENVMIRKVGGEEAMPGKFQTEASRGDRLVIKTPGGGGWGRADK
jgi:N-methylhydantoinase B/oxoprolinase/acetone carboxylase alpha subunit